MNDTVLFSGATPSTVAREREQQMIAELDQLDVISMSEAEVKALCEELDEKYRLDPAELERDDNGQRRIGAGPVREGTIHYVDQLGREMKGDGYLQSIYLYFLGEPESFTWTPNMSGPPHPYVDSIGEDRLVIVLGSRQPLPATELQAAVNREVSGIEVWLRHLTSDARSSPGYTARQEIEKRKRLAAHSNSTIEEAGFFRVDS